MVNKDSVNYSSCFYELVRALIQKIESRPFFMPPTKNYPPGSYYHPPGRGILLILPQPHFF